MHKNTTDSIKTPKGRPTTSKLARTEMPEPKRARPKTLRRLPMLAKDLEKYRRGERGFRDQHTRKHTKKERKHHTLQTSRSRSAESEFPRPEHPETHEKVTKTPFSAQYYWCSQI